MNNGINFNSTCYHIPNYINLFWMTSEFTICKLFSIGVHKIIENRTILFMSSVSKRKLWSVLLKGPSHLMHNFLRLEVRQKSPRGNNPVTPRPAADSDRPTIFSPLNENVNMYTSQWLTSLCHISSPSKAMSNLHNVYCLHLTDSILLNR